MTDIGGVFERPRPRCARCERIYVRDCDGCIGECEGHRLSRHETQRTVTEWADETFGTVTTNARIAARANEEMSELMTALSSDDAHPKAAEEVADVVIVLYRLASRLGVDLETEILRKMKTNRGRTWRLDGTGHGYHVKDGAK